MFAIGQNIVGCMSETIGGFSLDDALRKKIRHVAVKGDFAETDDDAELVQLAELSGQMNGAVANLLRRRLVPRRSAANHRSDPGMA